MAAKKRIYYSEFRRTLDSEPLRPVYLFTGAETFLKEEGMKAIIDKVVPLSERNLNLEMLYGSDISGADIRERALTMPFFASNRVIAVRQVEKWKASDIKAVADYAERASDSTTLILSSSEERLKSEGWNALASKVYHVECYPLFDNQVPEWIERRCREHGKRISRDAVYALIARVGTNLADLDNELGKLASYLGVADTLKVEDIQDAAGHQRQDSVFDFNRALGNKQWREAVRLAQELLDAGAVAPQMLSAIAWHLRTLYAERRKLDQGESLEAVLIGVRNPQAKQERAAQLKKFTAAEFPEYFKGLLALDEHVKTGRPDWEMHFMLMLLRWAKKASAAGATA